MPPRPAWPVWANLKVKVAVAAVAGGAVATGGLIWASYGLARGAAVFGGRSADWGTVAAWAGGIATFLAALVALLVAAGVFNSLTGPQLRITFEHAEPWCRTGEHGELWVRVGVENVGRGPAHGCVGRITGLATGGRTRTDLDPVQLRWAGVPRSRAFDAIDIRPSQREFLNVLVVRPGATWRLVTFEDPDFDPGFDLDLAPDQKHLLTLSVFADDVDAPTQQLAAEMTGAGEIIALRTLPARKSRRGPARILPNGENHGTRHSASHRP